MRDGEWSAHRRGGVDVLEFREDFLSVFQLLVGLAEQRLEDDLRSPPRMSNTDNQADLSPPRARFSRLTFNSSSTCLSAFTLCWAWPPSSRQSPHTYSLSSAQ